MVIKNVSLDIVCGITSKLPDTNRPEVAFAGKSNVGKSSLINALMNRKALARTSSQPGKTQTINFYNINDLLYFVDLPGYGYAKVSRSEKERWARLMETYFQREADAITTGVLIVDIRHKPTRDDMTMAEWFRASGKPWVIIANKLDKIKKSQGFDDRDRLLLRIAVILHGCGKFISLSNAGESAYHIIMAMDIIGLSEEEKEIVANVVKYNTVPLEGYDKIGSSRMTRENYLTIAKLTAILGVVNSLDRSHKQKTKEAKQILHENELVIQLYSDEDLSLEKKEFAKKAEFFEEVFSIRPVLRQKKMM